MTVDVVRVDLGSRSYDVRIGLGLLDRAADEIMPLLRRQKVAVITDETVAATHLDRLAASFVAKNIAMSALSLPPGEATKGWVHLERAVEWLLDQRVERGDVVVALGGGVVGDLAGFAAAIGRAYEEARHDLIAELTERVAAHNVSTPQVAAKVANS